VPAARPHATASACRIVADPVAEHPAGQHGDALAVVGGEVRPPAEIGLQGGGERPGELAGLRRGRLDVDERPDAGLRRDGAVLLTVAGPLRGRHGVRIPRHRPG
jgi:hypothetical protein